MVVRGLIVGIAIVTATIFVTVILHRAIDEGRRREKVESYKLGFMIAIANTLTAFAGIILVTLLVPSTILYGLWEL